MGYMYCICNLDSEPEPERRREMDQLFDMLSSGYTAFVDRRRDMIYVHEPLNLGREMCGMGSGDGKPRREYTAYGTGGDA